MFMHELRSRRQQTVKELGTVCAKLFVSMFVCVCVIDRSVGLPIPFAPVRNLPFSLFKAGETMERGEVDWGGG